MCACSLKESTTTEGDAVFGMLPSENSEAEARKCSLCRSIPRLQSGNIASAPEKRATAGDEVRNLQIMLRVVFTLCEIALCQPLYVVATASQELACYYDSQTKTKEDLLQDIRVKMGIPYARVVRRLWRILEDRNIPAAPFDLIYDHLEQARQGMQAFHDNYLCSAREKDKEKSDWAQNLQRWIKIVETP
jgi:hypothetical protein